MKFFHLLKMFNPLSGNTLCGVRFKIDSALLNKVRSSYLFYPYLELKIFIWREWRNWQTH